MDEQGAPQQVGAQKHKLKKEALMKVEAERSTEKLSEQVVKVGKLKP